MDTKREGKPFRIGLCSERIVFLHQVCVLSKLNVYCEQGIFRKHRIEGPKERNQKKEMTEQAPIVTTALTPVERNLLSHFKLDSLLQLPTFLRVILLWQDGVYSHERKAVTEDYKYFAERTLADAARRFQANELVWDEIEPLLPEHFKSPFWRHVTTSRLKNMTFAEVLSRLLTRNKHPNGTPLTEVERGLLQKEKECMEEDPAFYQPYRRDLLTEHQDEPYTLKFLWSDIYQDWDLFVTKLPDSSADKLELQEYGRQIGKDIQDWKQSEGQYTNGKDVLRYGLFGWEFLPEHGALCERCSECMCRKEARYHIHSNRF